MSKKGKQSKHVHVDKHAGKRPTQKDAWRKNDTSDKVNVAELLDFVRSLPPTRVTKR